MPTGPVINAAPAADEYGQVVRVAGTVTTTGGGGGGGAVTIADGADVAEGATTDAAVITDTTGTISGKLRGLVKWAFERMPASLGQKLMAASFPVVIASDQSAVPVSGTVTATGPLTDTQLRATPVPVSGPLTDTQLRATPVPVSGTVTASGPLTDAQLRATPVPVSGTVTASGPLTDAQLRATPVPVSGTVTATGPLTDTQLRATPVPVSGTVTTKTPLTGAVPATVVVGLTSALAVASNGSRKGLVLINTGSTARISLGLNGNAAVLSSGITLEGGQSWVMDEFTFTTGQINAIASLAAQALAIQELT